MDLLSKVSFTTIEITTVSSFDSSFQRCSNRFRPCPERVIVFEPSHQDWARTPRSALRTHRPYIVTRSPSPTRPPKRYETRNPLLSPSGPGIVVANDRDGCISLIGVNERRWVERRHVVGRAGSRRMAMVDSPVRRPSDLCIILLTEFRIAPVVDDQKTLIYLIAGNSNVIVIRSPRIRGLSSFDLFPPSS